MIKIPPPYFIIYPEISSCPTAQQFIVNKLNKLLDFQRLLLQEVILETQQSLHCIIINILIGMIPLTPKNSLSRRRVEH